MKMIDHNHFICHLILGTFTEYPSLGFYFSPVGGKHFSNWEFSVLLLFQSQSYEHAVIAFGQRPDGL